MERRSATSAAKKDFGDISARQRGKDVASAARSDTRPSTTSVKPLDATTVRNSGRTRRRKKAKGSVLRAGGSTE